MASQQQQLEILIKTIADTHGIKLTDEGLRKVKERTEELGRATGGATGEFKGFTSAQKEEAAAIVRGIEAKEKASQASKNLSKDLGSLKAAGGGLTAVIGGALSGNIVQVGRGLLTLGQAANNASTAIKGLFGQFARGAAAGSVAAAPALIAIQAMKAEAAEAEATMKRWWDEAAKAAEAYRQRSAEVTAAAAKDLEELRAEVARTAAEYDALLGRMDTSARRADELASAQKELELAQAKTPEERAAIEARYAATGLANEQGRADLQIRNAEAAEAQARQNIRDAEARVRDAEAAFSSNPTREGRDAINAAKANLEQVQKDASPVFTRAAEVIDSARHNQQLAGIRGQTLSVTTAQATAETLTGGRTTELRRAAQDAMARGDYAAQDRAVAELRKVKAGNEALVKTVVDFGATTAPAISEAVKEIEKQKRQVKNARETTGGGG